MKIDKLKSIRENNNKLLESNNKTLSLYTNIRLVVILALIVTIICAITNNSIRTLMIIFSIILFIVTIVLSIIMSHYKLLDEHYNYKNNVIKDYLARMDNTYKSNTTGLEFSSGEYFETDLDILGKSSIYSYINFSKTPYGKEETAYLLSTNLDLADNLINRQEASYELVEKLDSTLDILSYSYKYDNLNPNSKVKELDSAIKTLETQTNISLLKFAFGPICLAIFITVLVLSIMNIIPMYSPLILIVIGYFLSNFLYPEAKVVASDLAQARISVASYLELIKEISKQEYENNYLNDLIKPIKLLNNKALKSFNIISGFAESRNNILYQVIFDGSIMIDSYVLLAYSKWQKKYSIYLKDAFKAIGKLEGLISISTINIVKEECTTPIISNNFNFEDIKHPLIKESICIPNSFNFKSRNIITGSNMSGKTTFMRSIGTNYVLFLSGSNVCAKSFNAPILKLFTSMKVVDDVNNNISTFYGEILRVKKIVEYINEEKGMLVLVDEIFKGTNTHDRIIGAKSFIDKLNKDYIYSIITTHDPELCEVDNVLNYHFEEHYEDDKILFDYKIHDGISNTRNAIYLLKLAGIVEKE